MIPSVTPFAGVWIEMIAENRRWQQVSVTPFAGVWIEILELQRGYHGVSVTPFAGVWIEMVSSRTLNLYMSVTPFAGVWIEIPTGKRWCMPSRRSLPSRECGLKFDVVYYGGASYGHSLRGSVD